MAYIFGKHARTLSIPDEKDKRSFTRNLMVWFVWALAHNAWKNIVAVGKFFDGIKKEDGILWTMFRLGGVLNGQFPRFCIRGQKLMPAR
jgi:hypothetical protein